MTNGHVFSLSFLSSVRVLCQPPVGDTRYFTFTLKNKRKGKKKKAASSKGEDRGRANCDKEPTPPGELAASTLCPNGLREG